MILERLQVFSNNLHSMSCNPSPSRIDIEFLTRIRLDVVYQGVMKSSICACKAFLSGEAGTRGNDFDEVVAELAKTYRLQLVSSKGRLSFQPGWPSYW